MNIKENWGILRRVIGVAILATALTACGGQGSSDATSSTSSATDNTAAVVSLSSALYAATVNRSLTVTINRSGVTSGAATVGYTTVNGTATAGADYVATSGTVSWSDGEMGAKTVIVPVLTGASGKDFGFALTSVQGGANFGSPAAATIGVSTEASASVSSSSSSSSSSGGASPSGSSSSSSSSSSSGGASPSGSSSSGTANSSGSSSGSFNPSYPRLASAFIAPIAWNSSVNTAWTNWLAAMPVNITSTIINQGVNMYGGSFQAAVAQVKSLSNVSSKVYQYYLTDSTDTTYFPNGLSGPYDEANSFPNGWAWTDALTQSTHATSGGYQFANQTIGALPSGSSAVLNGGLNWEQWNAKYTYGFWIAGTNGAASTDVASNLDGLYHDNWGTIPGVSFDYNYSGAPPSGGTSDANFRESYGKGLGSGATWLTTNTSKTMLGNIGAWYPSGVSTIYQAGTAAGGLIEGAVGVTYGPDYYAGTSGAMSQYSQALTNTASPKMVIIGHLNVTSNGADSIQTTEYAAMRYGLTLALQNNGYYFASEGTGYSWAVMPFDEYWVNPSTGVACPYSTAASVATCQGYMGQPTSSWGGISGSGATQSIDGLNVRMFYNATTGKTWVAINAPHNSGGTGGGPYTISATSLHAGSAGFKMISGTQDTSVNNGATVSSITISTGYDGRIVQLL
jgi:hypothetical protein